MAEAICREIIRRRRRKKRKARGGRWEGEREEDGCQFPAFSVFPSSIARIFLIVAICIGIPSGSVEQREPPRKTANSELER